MGMTRNEARGMRKKEVAVMTRKGSDGKTERERPEMTEVVMRRKEELVEMTKSVRVEEKKEKEVVEMITIRNDREGRNVSGQVAGMTNQEEYTTSNIAIEAMIVNNSSSSRIAR